MKSHITHEHISSSPIPIVTLAIVSLSVFFSLLPTEFYSQASLHYAIRGLTAMIIVACVLHLAWRNHKMQQQILEWQCQLQEQRKREAKSIHKTQALRLALHDLRSPISSLSLSIHMLQKVSCDDDKKHLARMQVNLEAAIEHVEHIGVIQRNNIPTSEMPKLTLSANDYCQYSQQ